MPRFQYITPKGKKLGYTGTQERADAWAKKQGYTPYKKPDVTTQPVGEPVKVNQSKLRMTPAAGTTAPVKPTTQASYTIQSGDTLSAIARKQGTTVSALMSANPNITDPNKIYAGATLNIGKPATSVKPAPYVPGVAPTDEVTAPLGSKERTEQLLGRGRKLLADVKKDKVVVPEVIDQVEADKEARQQLADEANETADKIFDELPDGDDVDMRESATILDDIQAKAEEAEEAIPEPVSLADLFQAEKEKLGIEPLETELAGIDADIERINAELMVQAEEAGEQLISMTEIGRVKGKLQMRAEREIALLNVERSAVARQLNNKIDSLGMIMDFTQQDFQNASDYYQKEFTRSLQLYNLISGAEEKELTHAERAIDDARANWNTITGSLQKSNISYDTLTDVQRLKIESLEMQAGLPSGFTEQILTAVDTSKEVVMKGVSDDKTQAWIKYSDGTVEAFDTGLIAGGGEPTGGDGDGIADNRAIVELEDGSQADLLTPEGLKAAAEQGYSYEYLYSWLDINIPKLTTKSIEGLLDGAEIVSIKEKEKKEEESKAEEQAKQEIVNGLKETIEDYKDDWKNVGDKGAGTREEFGKEMGYIFPELTKEEIMKEIYNQVTDAWLKANKDWWGKGPGWD